MKIISDCVIYIISIIHYYCFDIYSNEASKINATPYQNRINSTQTQLSIQSWGSFV